MEGRQLGQDRGGNLGHGGGQRFSATDEAELEEEADKLYEWTQQLSYDDVTATPRLGTTLTASGIGSAL